MAKKGKTQALDHFFLNLKLKRAATRLASNICFAGIEKDIKILTITSPSKDEGKTTVSVNLADAFSQLGFRTLLIDADIHHKTISKTINSHYGVASILTNNIQIEQAMVNTTIENLYFLDCTNAISSISDLVSSRSFNQLLQTLKQNFDYIIIDTPPVLSCVDGALMSAISDQTLLVVRQNYSGKEDINLTLEQLTLAKANILGFVLNFSDKTSNKYYYDYAAGV